MTDTAPVVGDVRHVSLDDYVETVRQLHDDGFNMCVDVTAVDYLTHEAPRRLPEGVEPQRFELVVGLLSLSRAERVRIRVQVPGDEPHVPSLIDIYPGADAFEREVFDMFGIVFEGHPNLKRIMLADDWDEGFPLRKDYPLRGWKEFPVYNTERTVGRVRTRWTGRGV